MHKVANRQTDKQTNNDDYISSLVEVIKRYRNLVLSNKLSDVSDDDVTTAV